MKKRTMLTTMIGMLLIVAMLAGCAAPAAAPSDSADGGSGGEEEIELTFAIGGGPGEFAGFQKIIDAFEEQNPGVSIEMLERPGQGFKQQIITELAAGEAADIIKVGFVGDFAFYAESGGTVDLTPFLEGGFEDDFYEAAWNIASYEGKPYGVPMVWDTHALFYNTDYIEQAGIEVPQSIDECWSWEEFNDMSRLAMENSDADYGHAALWNAKRWMLFLYGNGGQVLNDDLTESAINSEATIQTINWMKEWYDEGLSPGSTSMKSSERAEELFMNGAIAFLISGSWHMPALRDQMTSMGWDVTYLPCTPNGQDADLGGNGLAVTKDSEHPEIAAEFIKFATETDNMREYAASAFFNPVRKSAMEGLEYPEFNEQMLLFSEVASTIDPHHASVQGMSIFPQFTTIMADELDLAFVGGQDAETTAQNMDDKISEVLAE